MPREPACVSANDPKRTLPKNGKVPQIAARLFLRGDSMTVSYDFSNKTAIVTGGSKGIGRAIAERLTKFGAKVFVWDIAPTQVAGVTYVAVDVSKPDQIEKAVAETVGRAPSINILVNNAGYLGEPVGVEKVRPDDWRRVFDVNLTGAFEITRKIIPHMRRANWGRIVNMASVAGKEGFPNLSAYSAASAGVIAFTKSLGKELADTHIRVNAVAPAAADTDMIRQFSAAAIETMVSRTALKRLVTAEEVAELVLWLCSDACSFNTGAVFDLSGGRATY
jgi:2-dehydro-3-deoxy-L-rhamnonate dehydrogenase (NAD+)